MARCASSVAPKSLCLIGRATAATAGTSDIDRARCGADNIRVTAAVAIALSHHTRDAARLPPRRAQAVLQIAARAGTAAEIAGPHIGPGAAAVVPLAGGLAGRPVRVRRACRTGGSRRRGGRCRTRRRRRGRGALDHAGALDARHAAGVLDPRRHLVLQPADRSRARPRPDRRSSRRGSARRGRSAPRRRPDRRIVRSRWCNRRRDGRIRPARARGAGAASTATTDAHVSQ